MACFLFLLGDFATWRELIDSIEDQFAQASVISVDPSQHGIYSPNKPHEETRSNLRASCFFMWLVGRLVS
ncbi:MAG: hypothetical protein KA368_02175 [Acidobacteria bacterium]|nr:hypothetical protein [Acidobacteriota bacterium]